MLGDMSERAGVWIDHRGAVLVFVVGEGDERVARMESGLERNWRVAGLPSDDGRESEDRHRELAGQVAAYYDDVVHQLGACAEVFVLGPGEAKREFRKHMEAQGLGARIVAVESASRMTNLEIAAAVREHFRARGFEGSDGGSSHERPS
jgi:hypothetical protein